MKIQDKVILITGANRGIGKALVETALKHGAKKVYAAARKPSDLPNFNDPRVVPLRLDITDDAQISQAVATASDVDLLLNNAGVLAFASVLEGDFAALENDMRVNYFGTLKVSRAFAPAMVAHGGGIGSVGSIVGLASMPGIGGYSASKAALFSAIQAMRAELKEKNVEVYGIFPGPIDTDMARPMETPKTSATETAENIFAGILKGQEDIFPDSFSTQMGELWMRDPKGIEHSFASM